MLVHSMLRRSAVNGPGERAVIWFQGCDLGCRGCWNPSSHAFDPTRDRPPPGWPVEEVGEWILACPGIEGVTFSGGEPFQQAPELRQLCEHIRARKPALSIGVFTGYTLRELVQGHWHWRNRDGGGADGDAPVVTEIRQFLDFAVFGRFRQPVSFSDKPLCGSPNQEVVFFSDRYSQQDLQPQGYEVTISENGATAIITGFPPVD